MNNVNFYENLREAQMRLNNTVVLYDKDPYKVVAITDHKKDSIFRMYLMPINLGSREMERGWPMEVGNYPADDPRLGAYLDAFMEGQKEKCVLLRKMANSPAFNKFRPFPLGMCNRDGFVIYYERQPQRHREQGLTRQSIMQTTVTMGPMQSMGCQMNVNGPEWYSCIKGEHPDLNTCMKNMRDPSVENHAVAFHRDFALLRGPLDSLFVAYKTDVVGSIPDVSYANLLLGRKFKHLKEVAEASRCFARVSVQS